MVIYAIKDNAGIIKYVGLTNNLAKRIKLG